MLQLDDLRAALATQPWITPALSTLAVIIISMCWRAWRRSGKIRVTQLFIHPIKSCRGTSVKSVVCSPGGFEYDRQWVVVDADTHEVLTARTVPKLVLVHPVLHKAAGMLDIMFPPKARMIPVSLPLVAAPDWPRLSGLELWKTHDLDGIVCPASVNAALSAFLERPVLLLAKGAHPRPVGPTRAFPAPTLDGVHIAYQDGYPLLLVSEESRADVERRTRALVGASDRVDPKWATAPLVVQRFRPNIVVRGGGVPFAEDGWERVVIGACTVDLVSKCDRCMLPHVDPDTGIPDQAIPSKVLATFRQNIDPDKPHKNMFGVNGVPRGDAVIRVGDVVRVLKHFPQ